MRLVTEAIGSIWNDVVSPHSSLGDRALAVLILGLSLLASVLIFMIAYMMMNTVGVKEVANEVRVVVSKKFVPAHSNSTVTLVGRVIIPQSIYVPDTYSLCFNIGENVVCGNVKKEIYDVAEKGDSFLVSYGVGRLDSEYIITSIR